MYNRLWNRWSTAQHYLERGGPDEGGGEAAPGEAGVELQRLAEPVHQRQVVLQDGRLVRRAQRLELGTRDGDTEQEEMM